MKIGILTFHFAINYGAVIQAWALQTYLCSLGHDTVVINYDPRPRRYPWFVHALRRGLRSFILEFKFRMFRVRHLKETRLFRLKDEIDGLDFDAYIVGSDQVWNIDFFNFNRRYFLDFVPANKLKIAYAASVGEGKWESNRKELEKLLMSFDSISVRENYAKTVVDSHSALSVAVMPDPTFLLPVDEYRKLARWFCGKKGKTFRIFVYGLNGIDRCMTILDEVLKHCCRANVHVMKLSRCAVDRRKGMKFVWPSPIEWLREIMEADLVITDSFHGVALSFVLHKSFLTFYKQEEAKTSDRIATVLDAMGDVRRAVDLGNLSSLVQMRLLDEPFDGKDRVQDISSAGRNWLKEQLMG